MDGRPRQTQDLDAVSSSVAAAYFPHRLEVRRRERDMPVALRHVTLGPLTIARIGWGAEVSVRSDHPGAYAVNIPHSGLLEARVCGREVASVDGSATVCPPDSSTTLTRWTADCVITGVRLERGYLEARAADLGRTCDLPNRLDLRTDAGRGWLGLVLSVAQQAHAAVHCGLDERVARHLADAVSASLLLAARPEGASTGSPVRPRIVRRVMEAVEADPGASWTAPEMAQVAGVGVRRLQMGFRDHLGRSPREVLLETRLQHARRLLLEQESATVAEVGWASGFGHLGRFAGAYRTRFGESPSDTLRTRP